ncbi:uncharacterized protein JCM15063_001775 [Sporobolomyces koalae]|uniref:uncharacterized protein n=1 Tax=Sporobolomyces koalae TaxID=500713 RepID=UPI003177A1EB
MAAAAGFQIRIRDQTTLATTSASIQHPRAPSPPTSTSLASSARPDPSRPAPDPGADSHRPHKRPKLEPLLSSPSRTGARDPMDDLSLSSSASYANSWISWFLASKGNEYFCEVDEEYIVDRFNLTGLNAEVSGYSAALDLITDTAADEDLNDEQREQLETSARHLYGLIHARFIITSRGLSKMIDKYKKGDFGRCPRVLCYGQSLLPLGLSDIPYQKAVKLYCPRCEDLYSPKSSRHGSIDGAYFGSTFAHMLFMVYPGMIPSKSVPGGAGAGGNSSSISNHGHNHHGAPHSPLNAGGLGGQGGSTGGLGAQAASKVERMRPRIFGFQVHEHARLLRWQEKMRDHQIARLEEHERQGLVEQ